MSKAAPLAKSLGLFKTQVEKYVGNDFTKEALIQTTSTVADSLQEQITNYITRKNSIKEFQTSLQKFVSSTTNDKPVVFMKVS